MPIQIQRQFLISLSLLGGAMNLFAQSEIKPSSVSSAVMPIDGQTAKPTVALDGYCPVCAIEMRKWIKGDSRFAVEQDGKTYLFPSEEQKQIFLKNPDKYTPALGGNCPVCKVESGKIMDGSLKLAAVYDGRIFLFHGDEQRQMFLNNAGRYASADLASKGGCTVCRHEMQMEVPGKPEFTVIHKNMRYWFPSTDQLKVFLENPSKYEEK